ncbi:hypothetical protein F7725_011809 [Dissostichus mawsoni]|uniref:Uncharacterized protein n=1 Tax=Dissostichus mawsoni TaxID=36200 RepID=A0A7J5ZE29_DISMA|nr:hypothetical protein F7725_011809 [Dissostichus mawsoni]
MSWFNHVSQGSNQQQQPTDRLSATDMLCSTLHSRQKEGSPTMAAQHWTGFSTPSPEDFPSAPRGVVSPLSLENLLCASHSADRMRELEPISYVSLQEQRCVLSWFQGWTPPQRERFMQDLLGKAVPGKLRLWSQWFESWGEEERNHFLHILEEQDPVFVAHFYRSVAGTAGRD